MPKFADLSGTCSPSGSTAMLVTHGRRDRSADRSAARSPSACTQPLMSHAGHDRGHAMFPQCRSDAGVVRRPSRRPHRPHARLDALRFRRAVEYTITAHGPAGPCQRAPRRDVRAPANAAAAPAPVSRREAMNRHPALVAVDSCQKKKKKKRSPAALAQAAACGPRD